MKWQILLVLAAAVLIAADAPKKDDTSKKGQDKLDGTWTLTDVDMGTTGGKKPSAEDLKSTTLTFQGDKLTLTNRGKAQPATYKVDAGKKPAEIDISPTEGPEKGKTMKGIYSLSGDTLKVAFSRDESARPTELTGKSESGKEVMVMIFTREKK